MKDASDERKQWGKRYKVYEAAGQVALLFSRRQWNTREDLEAVVSAGRITELGSWRWMSANRRNENGIG